MNWTSIQLVWLAGLLGLLVGSFLNVVIYRLPKIMMAGWLQEARSILAADAVSREAPTQSVSSDTSATTAAEPTFNLALPASHCPKCQHPLRWYDNIPLLSWLSLRGRCRYCSAPIPWRYPLVELVSALASAWAIARFGATPTGVAVVLFAWCMICLTMIDLDTQLLPDQLTLPLLWLGLMVNLQSNGGLTDLRSAVIGAAAGYLTLWSIYWAFKLITGKEGMGYGDFKLLAALGAWFGWLALPSMVLVSSVFGAVVGIGLIVTRRLGQGRPIAFGPYLALAGCARLILGPALDAFVLGMPLA